MDVKFLGEIPLDLDIRINSDQGQPDKTIVEESNNAIYFNSISEHIISYLETLDQDELDGPIIKFE